jgi:hypothetical protein
MRERTGGIELARPPGDIDDILIAAVLDQRGTQAMQQLAILGRQLKRRLERLRFVLEAPGQAAGFGQIAAKLRALGRRVNGAA